MVVVFMGCRLKLDAFSLCKRATVVSNRAYRLTALTCGCGGSCVDLKNSSLLIKEFLIHTCGVKLGVWEPYETGSDAAQMF